MPDARNPRSDQVWQVLCHPTSYVFIQGGQYYLMTSVGELWPGMGKLEAKEAMVPACGRVGIHAAKQETK